MADYIVVSSTSNAVAVVVNQEKTVTVRDSVVVGPSGARGSDANVQVGNTLLGAEGSNVIITNVGNSTNVILDFTIPRGNTGNTGNKGLFWEGPWNEQLNYSASQAVSYAGNSYFCVAFNANTIPLGNTSYWQLLVQKGQDGANGVNGSAGANGANGISPTVQVGNVVTGAEGSNVTVINVGNSTNVILDFSIPRGNTGNTGESNTGNVVFDGNTIVYVSEVQSGDEFIPLTLGFTDALTANGKYLYIRAGDNPEHIHLDTGNNYAYDQFWGDDSKYLKLSKDGDVEIRSWDSNTATGYSWAFANNGILTTQLGIVETNAVTGLILRSGYDISLVTDNATTPKEWTFLANGDLIVQQSGGITGASKTVGDGANLTLQSGETVTGNGGSLTLKSGQTTTGDAGVVNIRSGDATTGNAGNLDVKAGDTVTGDGGDVTVIAGDTITGNGGSVTIAAGSAINNGLGGSITILSGNNVNQSAGDINLIAGITSSGNSNGNINLSVAGDVWTFGANGTLTFPDATSQNTAWTGSASNVDVTNTNGLTTTYYLTFTEDRTTNQVLRGDIDLKYRTDDNILTVPALDTLRLNVKQVYESTNALSAATGVVTHNCALGHIFVHSSISANFTANFTDVTIPANNATSFTLVLNQGGTAYVPTAVQINGQAQTVNWQGTTQPAGNANKKDVVSFSVVNSNGSWITLGQLTSFG